MCIRESYSCQSDMPLCQWRVNWNYVTAVPLRCWRWKENSVLEKQSVISTRDNLLVFSVPGRKLASCPCFRFENGTRGAEERGGGYARGWWMLWYGSLNWYREKIFCFTLFIIILNYWWYLMDHLKIFFQKFISLSNLSSTTMVKIILLIWS